MPRPSKPVLIRGVSYASMAAAADALDCTPAWLYQLRREGRLDDAGVPSIARQTNGVKPTKPINGVVYPSHTAAAQALGVSLSYLSRAIRNGTADRIGSRRTQQPQLNQKAAAS